MNTRRERRKLHWCNSRTGQCPISTGVGRPSSLTRAGCVGGLHILMPRSTAPNRVVRFSLSTEASTTSDELARSIITIRRDRNVTVDNRRLHSSADSRYFKRLTGYPEIREFLPNCRQITSEP